MRRATHITLEDVVQRLSAHVRVNLTQHWHSWPLRERPLRERPLRESDLAESLPYKVSCDAKPLFPLLYPEFFLASGSHEWIGYIDNDMLLGGAAFAQLLDAVRGCSAGVLPTLGENFHIGANGRALAHGPLTIFNTVRKRRSSRWRECGSARHTPPPPQKKRMLA